MRRCDLYNDIRRGRERWKGMRHSRGGVSPAETQSAFKGWPEWQRVGGGRAKRVNEHTEGWVAARAWRIFFFLLVRLTWQMP